MSVWRLIGLLVALPLMAACVAEIGNTGRVSVPCVPTACDDQNPCTDDGCSPEGQCVNTPNRASCDDDIYCNGTDTCQNGACDLHTGDPCIGGAECADTCDEA